MKTNRKRINSTSRRSHHGLALVAVAAAMATGSSEVVHADEAQIERGRYLAQIAGCGDCHTPGHFLGDPDMTRLLGGSDVGFEVPGFGSVYGPNLTPDDETGLGTWTPDQIVTAIRTGVTPEGRVLVPVMPWPNLAALSDEDAFAIAAFLKSLDPVSNDVPGPVPDGVPAPSFVMRVVPPGG